MRRRRGIACKRDSKRCDQNTRVDRFNVPSTRLWIFMMKFAVFNFSSPKKTTTAKQWNGQQKLIAVRMGQRERGTERGGVGRVRSLLPPRGKVIFMPRGSRMTPSAWATAACRCQSAAQPTQYHLHPPHHPAPCSQLAPDRAAPGGRVSLTGYLWQKCKINDVWREIVAKKCAKLNFGLSKLCPGGARRHGKRSRRSEALNSTTATENSIKYFRSSSLSYIARNNGERGLKNC